jgi:endonuclease/exonuclease/phosphatase family metal-dependent hydrolase
MRRSTLLLVALGFAAACVAAPRAAPRATALRVASYNIRHGRGMDDRVNLARTATVLRALAPDIVGLQEVDHTVQRSGRVDEARALGELLDMQHAFGAFMPYQGGEYGLAILSRFPITRSTPVRLPDGNEPRVALVAEVRLPNGSMLAVVNVHFDWVQNDSFRFAQATALSTVLDTLPMPYVLLGDFNDEPGSRTLTLFQTRATEVQKPARDRFTFSSTQPVKEIDFVFVAPARAWQAIRARPVTERMASDHRPVIAELELRAPR